MIPPQELSEYGLVASNGSCKGVFRLAYFKVTATNGQVAIINGGSVTKVIDYSTYRAIYQGSDTNNYQVKDSLDTILAALKG
ncbi:hypothetical protein [Pseudomonas citronellolis]|uniref:hypothetical protein n=1 Tax=Pseudomonas citronellolis TaxID=53408 RepID=UPI0021C20857|nr:hypothetical protein [Pseudomonas citronellolis]UXJ50117.1 hypothetical protein N5P21_19210 [Pseudomonas citronellolis]